jgi:hypothetical protein
MTATRNGKPTPDASGTHFDGRADALGRIKMTYRFFNGVRIREAKAENERRAAEICARRSWGRTAVVIAKSAGVWRVDTPKSACIDTYILQK